MKGVEKMSNTDNMHDLLMQDFVENYMEKIFYYCLKKTGNSSKAEDLTQDIALNVIIGLNKGTIPKIFYAWVWQIARNRYCLWAKDKRKRRELLTIIDIDNYEIEDNRDSVINEMIDDEQLILLRSELAFIKKDYRGIIVAYYIDNKSIKDIASSLSLSVDTVHQRLHRARDILKEGMNMVRKFGKKSYNPENISFIMSGSNGNNGQPWSIITHLLYKNIFLETYENPETAEELALELGIALPYMEEELEFLVREEMLRKVGNKYKTNFEIISKEEKRKTHEKNTKIQKKLTEKICELIDLYNKEDSSKVNISYIGYENAKWALLVRTFDSLIWKAKENDNNSNTYPNRPDGGAWTLIGYELVDYKEPSFVGLHGYNYPDKNAIKRHIDYGQYKFYAKDLYPKTPEFLLYTDVYTLWLVCNGKIDECDQRYIDSLLKYGYLKKNDDVIEPNVVVFDSRAESNCSSEIKSKMGDLENEICELIKQTPSISRGYIVDQTLDNGWLKYDENTINTVGAFIYK
jgi:RNA polymerase sigma factor (sigma-70 family)